MVDMRKSSFRVLLALLISCLYLSGCKQQIIEVSELEVHEIGAMWPEYSLTDAIEESDMIVRGTVKSKSDTLVHEMKTSQGKTVMLEYYREVILIVSDVIKGEETAQTYYYEMGGVYQNVFYQYEGSSILAEGTEVLLFLNENHVPLSITTIIANEDSSAWVAKNMLPETYPIKKTEQNNLRIQLDFDEYCKLVKDFVVQ